MPHCTQCGSPLPAGSSFCTHCGARAGAPAAQPPAGHPPPPSAYPPPPARKGGGIGKILLIIGGVVVLLGVLAASASYIAVPAAMRISVPEANPAISLAAALGVTFPFNVTLGIPLYFRMAQWLARF